MQYTQRTTNRTPRGLVIQKGVRVAMRWVAAGLLVVAASAHAGNRVALVIGNGAYTHTDRWVALPNPVRDAELMERVLKLDLKFDKVDLLRNATRIDMVRALKRFKRDSRGADVALLFYAGHATHPEGGGSNYLLPVDARADDNDGLKGEAVDFDTEVLDIERKSGAKVRVVLLDACRTNLLGATRGSGGDRGLAPPPITDTYTLIGYATELGRTAADGGARNSPYTTALAKRLPAAAGVSLLGLLDEVAKEVADTTRPPQRPTRYGGLPVDVDLFGQPVDGRAPPIDEDALFWQSAQKLDTLRGYENYLKRYPRGRFADLAALNVDRLRVPAVPPPKLDPWPVGKTFKECDACPEMVVIPEGEILMGSPASEVGRSDDEGPQHRVRVERLAVGKYEVTHGQWKACVRDGACRQEKGVGETWGGDDHPVVNVNWNDAQGYVAWLSRTTGATYRLLTEAEWEYAARAGTTGPRWWGGSVDEACRYANVANPETKQKYAHFLMRDPFGCDDGWIETSPAGRFLPNRWGLHDMLGNVWELVEDCWDAKAYQSAAKDARAQTVSGCDKRVARGGFLDQQSEIRPLRLPLHRHLRLPRREQRGLPSREDAPGPLRPNLRRPPS
jgi:formylglycine-generating enzyme required for sulfatase activity